MQSVYEVMYRDYKSVYYDYITDKELFDFLLEADYDDYEVPQSIAERYGVEDLSEALEKACVPKPDFPFVLLGQVERFIS